MSLFLLKSIVQEEHPFFDHDTDEDVFLGNHIGERGLKFDLYYCQEFDQLVVRWGNNEEQHIAVDVKDTPHKAQVETFMRGFAPQALETAQIARKRALAWGVIA